MQELDEELNAQILARAKRIPIFDRMGLQVESLSPGRCVAVAPHDRAFDGIFESFHGGLLMTVADTIACLAIMTQTGPDIRVATTDMNIRFLSPCRSDVRADAKVIKLGRTLCPVQVDLLDMDHRPVAIAQVNYIRLEV